MNMSIWESRSDYPDRTTLTLPYRGYCDLYPDGRVDLVTRTGGGHGDPGGGIGPMEAHWWPMAIAEAIAIGRERWGEQWSR